LKNIVALFRRKLVDALLRRGVLGDFVLHDLAPADLLVDGEDKSDRDDGDDEKGHRPAGTPANILEGLAGGNESIDHTFDFAQALGRFGNGGNDSRGAHEWLLIVARDFNIRRYEEHREKDAKRQFTVPSSHLPVLRSRSGLNRPSSPPFA
jgi:hypothetical protein